MELDELERATAWLYAAHWAHWYGDLDTVLNILKKIQLDTMGNNPRVNQEIEYYFLKPLVQQKEKTGDED